MWQKCCICNGTGFNPNRLNEPCSVCNGFKIINELTGLPVKITIITSNTTSEYFNTNELYNNPKPKNIH